MASVVSPLPTSSVRTNETDEMHGKQIEYRFSESFAEWLAAIPGSLAVTTYQAGKLAFLGWRGSRPSLLLRQFTKPMGLAIETGSSQVPGKIALVTQNEITYLANAPLLAPDAIPARPRHYDALYLPRATYHTGNLSVHDAAFGTAGLWFVNTRFSCLSLLSRDFSFDPHWQPTFISELAPEDRCHLNGLAVHQGKPCYVTALGETNTASGWRENKSDGGVLIDVEAGATVLRGLSMPHSPRFYDQKLWLLNSGKGELLCYDPAKGTAIVVCTLPAYLRGLTLIGKYAVIGLCQVREKHIFAGLPIQQRHQRLLCGLAVVDLSTGEMTGLFEFTNGCTEIYDVQFLPGARNVNVLNLEHEAHHQAISAPEFSYWLRPR